MIIALALLARLVTMDVCTAAQAPPTMDGMETVVIGQLVFSRHSADLVQLQKATANSGRCLVFTIFPGTPVFMTPGVTDQEKRRDAKLGKFVSEYKDYSKQSPASPKTFAITGRLKMKPDFKVGADGRGNGFGMFGSSRVALVVLSVEEAPGRQ